MLQTEVAPEAIRKPPVQPQAGRKIPFGGALLLPSLIGRIVQYVHPKRLMIWALCLIVPAGAWMVLNYSELQHFFHARERLEQYRTAVAKLEQQQVRLQQENQELQEGGFSMEKSIRERLFMVKPGEKILLIEAGSGEDGDVSDGDGIAGPGD